MKTTIFLFLFVIVSCKGQERFYEIDKAIEDDLKINKSEDDLSQFRRDNSSYFLFSSKGMKRKFKDKEKVNPDIKTSVDTAKVLIPNVCGCQLKNDTITIAGGLFYGGGVGYQLKITENDFDGRIIVASNSKSLKLSESDDFVDELTLPSINQDVKFYDKPKFELGTVIKGKVILTSTEYLKKSSDETTDDQSYMKILFECKLSRFLGF